MIQPHKPVYERGIGKLSERFPGQGVIRELGLEDGVDGLAGIGTGRRGAHVEEKIRPYALVDVTPITFPVYVALNEFQVVSGG
jgi:hypothetical protein